MSSNNKGALFPPKRSEDSQTPLQAIVLTDSYNSRFRPLTLERPRCLLKIANTPLIEYTFHFLALAGVKDVIVFLGAHADQVKSYIELSEWNSDMTSPFKIRMIVSQEALSVGDAMRALDERSLITSDFLLVSGDVIGSIDMTDILKEHEKRKQTDKNAIMTMVVRETGSIHRTRAKNDMAVFAIHPHTGQCLHYEPIEFSPTKKRITMNLEIFERVGDIEVRNDLIDCQIDVCSPEVPALFTENFDYQEIRRDFVHGVLTSDLMGKTIYCHVVDGQYAARIGDLATFDAVK
ncbi:putative translation initiation factor eIF-2B subunit epsilon [Neolecta irregularis DAH-3]|uniref:Putative translation initiation factor eIF-2B subunit epsilon n=1 Tax=Neolecta irregularis (strain DAH-3) TaxID=1198029 RepID=A0A1U7LIM9_NEOID|nr:putative translation initiation factor eIF-2B subunit epsilon [Neolecta irregularis DAH-3]|eukprot:OLL22499.1 putative translation initiation factor eIF-2B subunit epsilon [Neolecta irregularis DAH-3]